MKSTEPGGDTGIVRLGEFFFKHRGITPVPFWLILFVLTIYLKPDASYPLDLLIGLLLLTSGEILRMSSLKYARSITRTRSHKTGGRVIKEGPFGLTRNPIYIGNLFIGTGLTALSGLPLAIPIFICLFLVQYIPIVLFEEAVLAREYGIEYHEYKKNVPRWIGITTLKKKVDPIIGEVYNVAKIMRSERHTLTGIMVISAFMFLHRLI